MRVLVTGANGFIGSHLVEELARRGYEVRGLVRPTSDLRWLEGAEIILVRGDLRNKTSLVESVAGADYVFHLGAVIHASGWEKHRAASVEGTKNLLEACLEAAPRLKKFIFVSSISASGPSLKGIPKKEDDPCTPISHYGRGKLQAEEMVKRYGDRVPFVILRPPNVLGAREKEVQAVLRALRMRLKPLLGAKEKQTSFIMVEDLVEAIILAAEKEASTGKIFNVTDGQAYSWREPLDILSRLLGRRCLPLPYGLLLAMTGTIEWTSGLLRKRPPVRRNALRSIHDHYWIYDSGRIEHELGFRPRLTLPEGLQRIVIQSGLSGPSAEGQSRMSPS